MSVSQAPGRAVKPPELRRILGQFVTGVCAVTTVVEEAGRIRHDAIAVNSFTSVSLEPPLVSMYLRSDSTFLRQLRASGRWAVSFVGSTDRELVRLLTRPADRREGIEQAAAWETGPLTGCLTLPDGPGTLECALKLTQPLGDHHLVVGEVLGVAYRDHEPLVFHRGGFTGVAPLG
ncbi:flavin reductase family protein [Streptomyces sp. NRRL WC-3742]|uniref:flavin reductase family protein n=1 Tax=Streptomyces sp. NRRL WC-3742 TaxID=1463934 RepID=UPI0006913552|nr:flavin reductase family protein [Streptomyces sp. NRRL WC-3742]